MGHLGGQKAGPLLSRHGGGRDRAALPPRLQAPPKAGAAPCDGGEAGIQSGVGAALRMKLCPWLSTQDVPPLPVALYVYIGGDYLAPYIKSILPPQLCKGFVAEEGQPHLPQSSLTVSVISLA